jgi:hypothetical protein
VKSGLIILLAVFGISFMSGVVQSGTRLNLYDYEIKAYTTVAEKASQLTAPYQYLVTTNIAVDLLALIFVIISVVSLHSISNKHLHLYTVILAPIFLIIDMGLNGYYNMVTQDALAKLPTLIDSGTWHIASEVDQKFATANGFWGSPTQHGIVTILSFLAVAILVIAIFTTKVSSEWLPPKPVVSTPIAVPLQPAPAPVLGDTQRRATKFCRYCGAKILRDSKFCEECGKRL